ncbi:hypothetical protein LPJ79_005102 [Coemansia sp. RSA 1821]|nr:hypothetical protein LPJ68_004870 [Coemansia sp. RSA 1086]KAJ1747657.1 hypothetical protein LPJ79_005102 [Coemansia sp. RSA 1821]
MDVLRFQQVIADAEKAHPFIIKGAISHWPALNDHSWSDLAYLQETVGSHRLVPVELGTKYTDKDWTQKLMPFGKFLEQTMSMNEAGVCGYMAQHNLLDQAFKLKNDFIIPDYAFVETGRRLVPNDQTASTDGIVVNVWIGPQGTVSPLHFDNYDNLFAQVAGYKYFCLYSPSEAPNLYPYPPDSHMPNTSQVDMESVDLNRYPCFAKASSVECVVEPGDLLYIPPKWWHFVRSHSYSASISMWF